MNFVLICLAVLAGAMLPAQGTINGQLGRLLNNVIFASLISFSVGAATLLVVFLLRNDWSGDSIQGIRSVPPVLYIGGILGAFYVTLIAFLVPKIGVANTTVAVIFGQVLLSLWFDHIGAFGIEVRELSWSRASGMFLVLSGLVLVVKS